MIRKTLWGNQFDLFHYEYSLFRNKFILIKWILQNKIVSDEAA